MSLQALDEPARVPAKPERATRERIPPKVRHACELLADGDVKTIKDAAAKVGMSREWLSKMLSRSHVQAFLARESAKTIASATPRASRRFIELMDCASDHVSAKVCDRLLTNAGVLKADVGSQVAVNVGVSVGYVLDLRDDRPRAAVSTHERVIEAKPLTDKET